MAKKTKKVRKGVTRGIAYVRATFNNTIVTITDTNGETLCWDSAGTVGFKGSRKSTPFAATRAAEECAGKARKLGMVEVEVRVRGAGTITTASFFLRSPRPGTLTLQVNVDMLRFTSVDWVQNIG